MDYKRQLSFKVLCDNFVEFNRFFKIACKALCISPDEFILEQTIPVTLKNSLLGITFTALVGFNRWGDNYWESSINKSLFISENPDVLVLFESDNTPQKLFAVEFCSALPAGNQSWQRFARGKQLSKNGTDYFFISELGGSELGENRKQISIRFPNPIVNFGALSTSKKPSCGLFVNLLIKKPGCPDEIAKKFENCLGIDILERYILNLTLGKNENAKIYDHQRELIKCFIAQKRRRSFFEIDFFEDKPIMPEQRFAPGWKKRRSIDVTNDTKSILSTASRLSNGYYGTDLPFVAIQANSSNIFCNEVNQITAGDRKIKLNRAEQKVFFAAIAGFKPRGDDARPDRGLVPLLDSIVATDSLIVSLVFGPAPSNNQQSLLSNPRLIATKNGLWGSVLQNSDYVIATSVNFTKTLVFRGYRGQTRKRSKPFTPWNTLITPEPNENDVDTAIHLTCKRSCGLFESMCNPPGGDWSGVSFFDASSQLETRYLTLSRAPDRAFNKRPDHIYHDSSNKTIYVVESKTSLKSLFRESDVGNKMVNWTNHLLSYIPQVKRIQGNEWTSNTEKKDMIPESKFIKCGAFAYTGESPQKYIEAMEKCALDILFVYHNVKPNWYIEVIYRNSDKSIPKCLLHLDHSHV